MKRRIASANYQSPFQPWKIAVERMEKLLTVEEIAEYLKLRPSTIYQWTHQGFIPHIKVGNRVRFKISQIEKWLEKRTLEGRARRRLEVTGGDV